METIIVEDGFDKVVLEAHREKVGALDIETTVVENPWASPPQLVSVGITFDGYRAFVLRPEQVSRYKHVLEHTDWIMHNGLFDRLMLLEFFGIDAPLKHDTMALQYLLDPDKPKGLQDLTIEYLDGEEYKDVDYKNILDEPFEKVAQMNGEDACNTFNLFRPLADQMNDDPALSRVYQWILMPAVNELIEVTRNGIPLDLDRLKVATDTYQRDAAILKEALVDMAPTPEEAWAKPSWWRVKTHGKYEYPGIFNPGSPKQVGHILFDMWQLPVLEETDTGAPSTNADVLLVLETSHATGDAEVFLSTLREYRKVTKVLTYLEAWPSLTDAAGWLHPRYKPLHTVTGRLSSDQPNIQNVPRTKQIRSVFGGVEGMTWLKADYSQVELRLAALQADEDKMLAAFRDEADIHTLTATLVLGDDSKDARQVGKTLNFGLLYGAGPATLQRVARNDYGVFLSISEARSLRERWFRAYPGIAQWHERMEAEISLSGISVSPLGRIRYLPKAKIPLHVEDMRPQKWAAIRQGINHPVQSFASDLLLMSLNRVAPLVRPLGVKLVAEVHDEIDGLVPNENVSEVSDIFKATMEDVSWLQKHGITLGVPLLAEVETGPYWGEVT